MTTGTLVVGGSQAGLQLAVSLRELGYAEPITLVGEEERPPYQRPPLSKALLAGEMEPDSLSFRSSQFYADADIELLRGDPVTSLVLPKTAHGGSGVATTGTGRSLPFERLALTVGAEPRRLDLPGSDLEGVCYLRDADDALLLRRRLESAVNVVVVGGGFIGLEAAAVARSYGKAVTVVEVEEHLMSRAVAPVVSEFYRRAHIRRGTSVLVSTGVSEFDGERGRLTHVHLSDGTRLRADLVLVAVGIVPRTSLAEQIALECDGGIVVDTQARTSADGVVAAGDCTVRPDPMTGRGRVRLESVQNAVAQARSAASSIVGGPDPAPAVPWFWSDQYDLKLQIAGLADGHDHHVVRGEPDSERFSVLYYRYGRLSAVHAINRPSDYMTVRKTLSAGGSIPAEKASDTDAGLKTFIVDEAGSAHGG